MTESLIFLAVIVLILFGSIYTVKQKTAVIIERLGKFQTISTSGLKFKIPFVDKKVGVVNLRVMELPVDVETKTLDNVFVRMVVSIQYFVVEQPEEIRKSFYQFDDPHRQIRSYVFDSIRSEIPKLILDDVFAEKDKIAIAVKKELDETINNFGFNILQALVTDIDPDPKVKESMNEINAAKRMKEAAKEYAEAEKIKVVAAAEAESQSKKLQGEGIADQRIAIANGIKESVKQVQGAMEEGVTGQEVMNMLFMTQHYETMSKLGDSGVNTIFVPYTPGSVGDLQTQIQSSLIAAQGQQGAKA